MSPKPTQIEFLYQSIADTQGTIRALDVKIGFLLLIVFSPLFAFDKLGPFLNALYLESTLQHIFISLIALLWLFAIFVQFMALKAVSNPATKVRGASDLGVFYSGHLYQVGITDAFWDRRIYASATLAEEIDRLPKTEEEIIEELMFEKMKLTYIRSIKLKRINFAVWSIAAWLFVGLLSYGLHLMTQC
jgi:hypothetical protein